MLWKMFTVYDSKAECYLQPFFFKARGEAIRSFTESCNDNKNQLCRHAGDFTLYELGEYDDHSADFLPLNNHVNLGKAIEFQTGSNGELDLQTEM